MDLKLLEDAISRVKGKKANLDNIQQQVAQASLEYNDAVTNVQKIKSDFDRELNDELKGVMPENAPQVRVR